MKQTTLNILSNHTLSIITGFLAGMVFIAGMSNISSLEPKDYWQTVGSLSAGFGTLAILIFGWLKADEWKKQNIQHAKLNTTLELIKTINSDTALLSEMGFSVVRAQKEMFKDLQIKIDAANKDDPIYSDLGLDRVLSSKSSELKKLIHGIEEDLMILDRLHSPYFIIPTDRLKSVLVEFHSLIFNYSSMNRTPRELFFLRKKVRQIDKELSALRATVTEKILS